MMHTHITHSFDEKAPHLLGNAEANRRIDYIRLFFRDFQVQMTLKPYTICDFRAEVRVDLTGWRKPQVARLTADLLLWTESCFQPYLTLPVAEIDLAILGDPGNDELNSSLVRNKAHALMDYLIYRGQCFTAGRIVPPGPVHRGAGLYTLTVSDEFAQSKEERDEKAPA